MMMSANAQATGRSYPVFNYAFEDFSNERLYSALCAATAPLDAGLKELQLRLKPIIINAAQGFLKALSWTIDNAMGEALIFIWDLVRKHSYKEGRVPFHNFFGKVWHTRLIDLFQKLVIKTPINMGNYQTGWYQGQPVYCSAYAFHPKAEEYREKKAAQQKAWDDRRRAEQGLPPRQPRKPAMSAEERRERARLRARARYEAMTPEERAEVYAKNNARRKAARDAETPEQKAARNAHAYALAKARKAKNG